MAMRANARGVRPGLVPLWFTGLLQDHFGLSRDHREACVSPWGDLPSGAWLDHWGTLVVDGCDVFVTEPYDLTPDDMRALLKLDAAPGIRVHVCGSAEHNPAGCLRVMVYEDGAHNEKG